MAEAILKKMTEDTGLHLEIESCGTEPYHVGEHADARAIRTAAKHDVDLSKHIARQITKRDFKDFDVIYAMATDVYDLLRVQVKYASDLEKLKLFMDVLHPGKQLSVPDPWYGNEEGFEPVFELISQGCREILQQEIDQRKTA